jgi:ABC-2 type transport system ATP-binding protein
MRCERVIEVSQMTKQYGDVMAVDHISFEVQRGQIFGLLGPNGAGKTTTVRMLTGLTRPTSGNARIMDLDCVSESLEVRQRIGVVSETSNLYNEMSAWDNLMFVGELYGVDKPNRTARASELLRVFQLYERRNDRLAAYSKGMKRRVRVAAALVHSPEVLFLDEPTSGLDVQSARLIRSIVRELNKKGVTVFLTSHYIEEADQLCNRVAIIKQGRIIVNDSPETLKRALSEEGVLEVAFSKYILGMEALLRSDANVKGISRQGAKYLIHTADVTAVVKKVVEIAALNETDIVSINTKHPSLEDVFVRYTGLDAVQVERMELLRAAKIGAGRRG